MAPGQRPAAQPAPGDEVVRGHHLDDGAALLVLELADVELSSGRTRPPSRAARRVAAWRIRCPATTRSPLVAKVLLGRKRSKTDASASLTWRNTGSSSAPSSRRTTAATSPTLPTPTTLSAAVDEPIAVEQDPAVTEERFGVGGQADRLRLIGHPGLVVEDRRMLLDPALAGAVDLGELRQLMEASCLEVDRTVDSMNGRARLST